MDFITLVITLVVSIGLILYFRRKDKRNVEFNSLKNFIRSSIQNLEQMFKDKERELKDKTINLDIDLKKLEKASGYINKKLANIQDSLVYAESIRKDLNTDLNKAKFFDDELKTVKSKIDIFVETEKEIKALTTELKSSKEEAVSIKQDIKQARIWADDNIGDFIKKTEDDLEKFKIDLSNKIGDDIKSIEENVKNKNDDVDYLVSKLENKVEETEDKFEKMYSEKEAHIESEFVDKIKKFQTNVSTTIKQFNDKLGGTARTINDLSNRVSKFIKENSEKFKGEIATIKSEYTIQANNFLDNVAKKEISMQSFMNELDTKFANVDITIQNIVKSATETALDNLTSHENEVYGNLEKSSGLISDRLEQIEHSITNYEEGLNSKMATMGSDLENKLHEYKSNIDNLQNIALNIEKNITENINSRTKEIDNYLEKLKDAFVDDYKQLIGNTKEEIITLKDEVESLQNQTDSQKDGILRGMKESIKSFKEWGTSQVSELKDEIDTTKMRTEGVLVDIHDELDSRFSKFKDDIDKHTSDIIRESENNIQEKKDEMHKVMKDLSTAVDAKERELKSKFDEARKDVEKSNQIMIDKLQGDFESKVNRMKEQLSAEIENGKKIKQDLESFENLIADIRENSNSNINQIKAKYDAMMDELNRFGKTVEEELKSSKSIIEIESDANLKNIQEKTNEFIQNIEEKIEEEIEGKLTRNYEKIDGFLQTQKTNLENEIHIFKETFIAPKDEILEDMSREAMEIKSSLDDNIARLQSHYESITERMDSIKEELHNVEGNTISDIHSKAEEIHRAIEGKIAGLTTNFDNYANKVENDFNREIMQAKDEIDSIVEEMEHSRETIKNEVIDDIKNLNKKTRELEHRYDSMMKKTSMLERAEKIAERSENQMSTIKEYLKEIEQKRKNIEMTLHKLNDIKIENKTAQTILDETLLAKNEAAAIHENIADALEKARETEALLSTIEEQQEHAEQVKTVLIEALRTYEEIKHRAKEVENKKNVINKILESIETSRDTIDSVNNKVESIENRVDDVGSIAKQLQDEIHIAQSNIDNIFDQQNSVGDAVNKLADIEHLMDLLDEEKKNVEGMRKWVANMGNELKQFESSGKHKKSSSRNATKTDDDEANTMSIVRLRQQGWSIDEIAKSLKMSRGYVELILERYSDQD